MSSAGQFHATTFLSFEPYSSKQLETMVSSRIENDILTTTTVLY